MSLLGRSLLDINTFTEAQVFSLFEIAKRVRYLHNSKKLNIADLLQSNASKYVAMMFFEPSTRTRSSFEVAAYKLGIQVLAPEFGPSSSRSKGESLTDTFLNVAAMDPDAIVVRFGEDPELMHTLEKSQIPVINAGSGKSSHPTQALLDAFTICEEFESLRGRKVLIVGDVRHGRVAQSNIKLLTLMGAEVAVCGPQEFMPQDIDAVKTMAIDDGIEWADVVMALRIQLERHQGDSAMTKEDYNQQFGVTAARMKKLGAGILMHPGPINQGVELDAEVLKDPRCRVLTQVKNGVYVRSAVMSQILGISF
jgi:aspartate carbamoyltransferase catalytic subunit